MRWRSIVGWTLIFISQSQTGIAKEVLCQIDKKSVCTKELCAETTTADDYIRYDVSKSLYQICAKKNNSCDTFTLENVKPSGVFLHANFQGLNFIIVAMNDVSPPEGVPERLRVSAGQFMEVRMGIGMSITSWGKCNPTGAVQFDE